MVEGSVSKNPFLRPGYGQKPQPNPVQNNFKPKPIPQKDMSKEIEFRGYFVLNSKPYFCLLNKKSNHAEWLSISEVSYEEFKVHEFNMESEILTVIYEGVQHELSLVQGGSSIGSRSSTSPSQSQSVGTSAKLPTKTRYMPPRPKTTPKLPDWLVNKRISSGVPFSSSDVKTNSTKDTNLPKRTFPSVYPALQNINKSNPMSTRSPAQDLPVLNRSTKGSSVQNLQPNPSSEFEPNEFSNDNLSDTNPSTADQEKDLNLDGLPPPPPPPNIIPPSPPPDIIPSLEN